MHRLLTDVTTHVYFLPHVYFLLSQNLFCVLTYRDITFDQCQIFIFLAGSFSVANARRADMGPGVLLLIAKKSVVHGMRKSLAAVPVSSGHSHMHWK